MQFLAEEALIARLEHVEHTESASAAAVRDAHAEAKAALAELD